MATALEKRIKNAAAGKSKLNFSLVSGDEPHFLNIPVKNIESDPNQPRTLPGDIDELKASIKTHGILQPIILSPLDREHYRIIAGERRYTAAKAAGLKSVPAIVRTVKEQQRLEFQIIENLHRKDLNPVEEAVSYRRLMDEFNLTQRDVGKRVGKSESSISETLRILDLPNEEIKKLRTSEVISKSVLLEIVKHPDEDYQLNLLERAERGNLSVREARATKKQKSGKPRKQPLSIKKFQTSKGEILMKIKPGYTSVDDMKSMLLEVLELLGENHL